MLANPRPIANGNTTRWNRRGSASQYHLTVSKNFWTGRNDPGWSESFEQPVIPPAPLTGDVGRDCGDASRALLFIFFRATVSARRKSGVPWSTPDFFGRTKFTFTPLLFLYPFFFRRPLASCCANCAGRTAPGLP